MILRILKPIDSFFILKDMKDSIMSEGEVLTKEDISKLEGEEFFDAVTDCLANFDSDDIDEMTEEQLCAVSVYYFDLEIQNGGLCQFFVNSTRKFAPYISDSLDKIGAKNIRKLFDSFIWNNVIDVNDLDSFAVKRLKDFKKQTQRYPFDEFDEKYYELYEKEDVMELMVAFVKDNFDRVIVDGE